MDYVLKLNIRSKDAPESPSVLNPDLPEHKDEVLTIQSLVAPTADSGKKHLGKWGSYSPYIGTDYAGPYYIKSKLEKNEEIWCLSFLKWSGTMVSNPFMPVGFFFDEGKETPFLVLEGFDPMRSSSDASFNGGVGHLISTTMTDLWSSNLHWEKKGS